ncbi:MAG: nucleoside triphosphate pyrophosphohydrolase [Clostridia bacterium]|nr:nucleoside triphosphate pyrophosphohydrolase [Clostridia bacterium]
MNELKKKLLEKERFSFEDLRDVMRVLRGKGGCPWDAEQTHESIREDFIEETYEVCEAIDTKNTALLREELGDVLLQVVFHTQMEEENGVFTMEDVTTEVCQKLIYRHPHVFADTVADTSDEVLVNWEKLKNKEKHRDTVTDTLKSVPKQYPALLRAQKVGKKAAKVGFDFASAADAAKKIEEETKELLEAPEEMRKEELGDLLFAVVNTARQYGISAEEALANATDKFISRFERVENGVIADGKDMRDLSLSELDCYWDKVKLDKNSKNN